MRLTLLLAGVLCWCTQGIARPFNADIPNDSIVALYEQDIATGEQAFEQKLSALEVNDDLVAYLQCLKDVAIYFRRQEDYEKNVELLQRGTLEEAWRAPADSTEWSRLGWFYVQLGFTHYEKLGNFAKAAATYQSAADMFNRINERSTIVTRFVHWPLANTYTRLGENAAAEPLLKQVVAELLANDDFSRAGLAYNDLGLLYTHWGKKAEALLAFQEGLNLPEIGNITRSILIINLSDVLITDGKLDEAEEQLLKGEELMLEEQKAEEPHPRSARSLAGIYLKLAHLHLKRGQHDEALAYFDKELDWLKDYYGLTQRREFGKNYIARAEVYLEQEAHEQAVQSYQAALSTVLLGYRPIDPGDLPEPHTFYAENTILEALDGLAQTYAAWFEEKRSNGLLDLAMKSYQMCYQVEEILRKHYLYDTSKLLNLEESRLRSEQAIRVAQLLFKQTGQEQYLTEAFIFAERNRSSLLREAFRTTRATTVAGISSAEQEKEQALKRVVSEAEELVFRLRSQEAPDSMQQQAEQALLIARDSLKDWISTLEQNHPKYYQLKYADAVPTVATLQSMLAPREILLEFFMGTDRLYVFKIDQSGLRLHELPLPGQLEERILRWRQSIENYQQPGQDRVALLDAYREEAHQLYLELLAPVISPMENIDRLMIISSGILDLVPFEALLSQLPAGNSPLKDYPYLLNRYSISYGYSASLQWFLHQLPLAGERMAGFAPSFDGSSGWPSLSCSAGLFEKVLSRSNNSVYADQEASVSQFRSVADRYRLLHLATHAQANPDQGDFSYIVFSDGQGGYDSLFAKDLYLYDLQAELVILSACETALGTLYYSEGVISLARAFHYAGARSVMTTLWRVNEGANCSLLEQFYAAIDGGADKKEALRTAKLKYLDAADPRAAHPVYWAGFQLLGNPRAVEPGRPWHLYGIGLVLLLMGGWWYRKRQRSLAQA